MDGSIPERLTALCARFPEATASSVVGVHHLIYSVRNRRFAYYHHDHHGDGEYAAVCKLESGMSQALVESDPARFYRPAYLASRGWIGIRLDRADTDWDEVLLLLELSYRLIAPKSLVRRLDEGTNAQRNTECETTSGEVRPT